VIPLDAQRGIMGVLDMGDAMQLSKTVLSTQAIEMRAIERGNGFRHLRANTPNGHAHGLFPAWNGAGRFQAFSHACGARQ
jgi:hypothetical protein